MDLTLPEGGQPEIEVRLSLGNLTVRVPEAMAVGVRGIERSALRAWLAEPLGITAFLHECSGAQLAGRRRIEELFARAKQCS